MTERAMRLVGNRPPQVQARERVTGEAQYVDDLAIPGLWHGVTLRSPIARGRIVEIEPDPDFDWSRVVLVDARDLPGRNVLPLILDDQPVLAEREIRHPFEPVMLIAAPDRALALEARNRLNLRYEAKPIAVEISDALEARVKVFGEDNVFKQIDIAKGDLEAGFAAATIELERDFWTGPQEQLYMEPQGMIAAWEGDQLVLRGSLQCPYYVQAAARAVFGLEPEQVRVIACELGGGFGGKEEYPSLLAVHAALLARKAGRPVKMVYDRAEDMQATTKRHPSQTRIRAGIDAEGRLTALAVDLVLDGGAYCTLSPVVLSRAVLHAGSAYACPNVAVRGRVVATNTPPNGAFRGFGAPQALFAMETMMDLLARAAGLDPLEMRRRNALRAGDETSTGQVLEQAAAADVLERAAEAADFRARRELYDRPQTGSIRRGIGLSLIMHGCGFTGAGESRLKGRLTLDLDARGEQLLVQVRTGSTDMGQGMRTTFKQIAAEILGLELDEVEVAAQDTALVPDSGPTVASRTLMIVGGLVARAARQALTSLGLEEGAGAEALRLALAGRGRLEIEEVHEPPATLFDEDHYRGQAYPSWGYACTICEVEVDMTTFEPRIVDVVTCQDVGRAIHPGIVEGQIQGGIAQGLGYAAFEEVQMHDGAMVNANFNRYIVPTAMDLPPIRVLLHESGQGAGPFGAKGIGEMPVDGAAPAYVSALAQALRTSFRELPVTPEAIAESFLRPRPGKADA